MLRPCAPVVRRACCLFLMLVAASCGGGDGSDAGSKGGTGGNNGNNNVVDNGNDAAAGGNNLALDNNGGSNKPSTPNGQSGNTTGMAAGTGVVRVAMTGCTQFDYFAQINIGRNDFSLLLDTGSTMMAVAANTCNTCDQADRYDISQGTNTQTTTNSTYADGSGWQGTIYADNVAFGKTGNLATSKVSTKFAVVTQANDFFTTGSCAASNDLQFDGILGLGPDKLLRAGTTSVWTGLAATKTLASDAFSFRHCNVGGDMWLGGYDANVLSAPPQYTPTITTGAYANYYSMNVNSILLAGTSVGASASAIGSMVVDNGTSALLVSDAAYAAITNRLTSNAAFLANFSNTFFNDGQCPLPKQTGLTPAQLDASLPKLTFVLPKVGGGTFNVELSAMGSYLLPLKASNNKIYYCPILGTAPSGAPPLYGNAAMRQHIVIFDRANARVGFAPHNTCPADSVAVGN